MAMPSAAAALSPSLSLPRSRSFWLPFASFYCQKLYDTIANCTVALFVCCCFFHWCKLSCHICWKCHVTKRHLAYSVTTKIINTHTIAFLVLMLIRFRFAICKIDFKYFICPSTHIHLMDALFLSGSKLNLVAKKIISLMNDIFNAYSYMI